MLDTRKAAVTGAGSGIGREIAVQLAKRNWSLSLADNDTEALRETLARCHMTTGRTLTECVDVAHKSEIDSWAEASARALGGIDAIFNVAGVLYSGDVINTPTSDIERVMATNFWGVVNSSKAFLPHIFQSKQGRIVNISSAFGLMSAPGYAAYNSSKFAVRGFTEALSQELCAQSKTARATCVIPGGIRTSIARTARSAPGVDQGRNADLFDRYIARTDPGRAATKIVNSALKGKSNVLVGPDAYLVDFAVRALGSNYQRIIPSLQTFIRLKNR